MSASLGILGTDADLCINFYPNAVYQPKQCLRRTFNAARSVDFPLSRVIFEVTEVEEIRDHEHLRNIMTEYRSHGLRIAIDDFGAGHSGLTLLSEFQPNIIKLDRALVRNLDVKPASRAIVRSITQVCHGSLVSGDAARTRRVENVDAIREADSSSQPVRARERIVLMSGAGEVSFPYVVRLPQRLLWGVQAVGVFIRLSIRSSKSITVNCVPLWCGAIILIIQSCSSPMKTCSQTSRGVASLWPSTGPRPAQST